MWWFLRRHQAPPEQPAAITIFAAAPLDMTEIAPNLSLGAAPRSPELLRGRIDAVLDLRMNGEMNPEIDAATRYAALGIRYRNQPFEDGNLPYPTVEILDDLVGWIEAHCAADLRVLVHCVMGMSRSVLVTMHHRMRTTGCDEQTAFDHIRQRRSIQPKARYRQLLVAYHGTPLSSS